MSKNAHFIPWYITQEYRPQAPTVDTLVNDEKSKVMTLWPGRMRTSVHKLQVVAIFYNYQDVSGFICSTWFYIFGFSIKQFF